MACTRSAISPRKRAPRARPLEFRRALAIVVLAVQVACGGGGAQDGTATVQPRLASDTRPPIAVGLAPASNVLPIHLDHGPRGEAFNVPFVSVTICVPGTHECQTIDHVVLDTGSSGLRIAASALRKGLALPPVTITGDAAGADVPVGQCMQFASGHTWGSVRRANVQLGGQQGEALAIQVFDDFTGPYATAPAACSSSVALSRVLDANGILGVGLRRHDCGGSCEGETPLPIYFGCVEGGCTATALARSAQVANPVAALAAHNNGVSIQMPEVPLGGARSITGVLVLGIATATNNQLGAARVFAPDDAGFLRATYKGATYLSFLDTGTNSVRFPDPELPECGSLYCPDQPTPLSISVTAAEGQPQTIDFTLESPASLRVGTVGARIGGGGPATPHVNFGLPFFFGRTVHVAIAGAPTQAGEGPYWAF
ncbi:DUF3443 family protein [Ramlibacter henchirensis]|nr:DUF3443 family protein [Ramlibacter henchirensis]